MTILYFVRHAQPNYENHFDPTRELTAKGLEDRKYVNRFFEEKEIDVILSSPFKRAVDTVKQFADSKHMNVEIVEDFKERRIETGWIENFMEFSKKQWADFSYKLSDGECLQEVQDRNIAALNEALEKYENKHIVVGSHGTALSTIINYYDPSYGYEDFERIRGLMPWIVKFTFDHKKCVGIQEYNVLPTEDQLNFERAVPADVEELRTLTRQSEAHWGYDETFMSTFDSEFNVTEKYVNENPVYVAKSGEKLIAFWGLQKEEDHWELEYFYIAESELKRGYGKQMWRSMTDWCKEHEIKKIEFVTSHQAIGFYERMGAKMDGMTESTIDGRKIPRFQYQV